MREGVEGEEGDAAARLTCSDPGNRFLDPSLLIQEEEELWRAARGRRRKIKGKEERRDDERVEECEGVGWEG